MPGSWSRFILVTISEILHVLADLLQIYCNLHCRWPFLKAFTTVHWCICFPSVICFSSFPSGMKMNLRRLYNLSATEVIIAAFVFSTQVFVGFWCSAAFLIHSALTASTTCTHNISLNTKNRHDDHHDYPTHKIIICKCLIFLVYGNHQEKKKKY